MDSSGKLCEPFGRMELTLWADNYADLEDLHTVGPVVQLRTKFPGALDIEGELGELGESRSSIDLLRSFSEGTVSSHSEWSPNHLLEWCNMHL